MQHILRRLITAPFHLFEKQQIIIVANEMEKVIICINVDFPIHLSGLVFHET